MNAALREGSWQPPPPPGPPPTSRPAAPRDEAAFAPEDPTPPAESSIRRPRHRSSWTSLAAGFISRRARAVVELAVASGGAAMRGVRKITDVAVKKV